MPPADPERLLAGLDPEQRLVATSEASRLAVIAGAGTGKTRAITHRIAYQTATGRFTQGAVLAVTFTTKAAGELRARLRGLGFGKASARTFHSAALRQARYFWPRVMNSELPEVLGNRIGLVAEAANRVDLPTDTGTLRDLAGEITWAKVSNVTPSDYAELAFQAGRDLAAAGPEQVAAAFEHYEAAKRRRAVIDYEDILLCAALVLSDHPDVATEVQAGYRHLLVDEYQDVNPLQQRLLRLWLGPGSDLCVVGDPAQTIHSFAGARSDYLTEFPASHRGAEIVRLVRDYRSTNQVVSLANRLSGGTRGVQLQAQAGDGPEPEFAEAGSEPGEAAAVADWLERLAATGVPYNEMAVLYRINAQSPAYESVLAERGIAYQVRGADGFYARPEVRQALRDLARQVELGLAEPAEQQVKGVLANLGWTPQPPPGGGSLRERWESLAALADLAFGLMGEADDPLAAVVGELQARAEIEQVPAVAGVTLSTIHSAKGLEWDAVAVVGVQEGLIPFALAQSPLQVAEEKRLLYVAVTRARRHLRLSWSRGGRQGGGARGPSRFLGPVKPQRVERAGSRVQGRKRTTRSSKCTACGQPLVTGADQKLRRHTGCPATFDPHTLDMLIEWRRQVAAEQSVPAYVVFTDATLIAAAEARPSTDDELLAIAGVGPAKLAKYGAEMLAILAAGDAATGDSGPASQTAE